MHPEKATVENSVQQYQRQYEIVAHGSVHGRIVRFPPTVDLSFSYNDFDFGFGVCGDQLRHKDYGGHGNDYGRVAEQLVSLISSKRGTFAEFCVAGFGPHVCIRWIFQDLEHMIYTFIAKGL